MMNLALSTAPVHAAARTIRVFVAEDHRITLWGLQRLIESAGPLMALVGTASSRAELVNHAALADADVLVLDLDLGGEDSADALADLRRLSDGHVLVLTGAEDVEQHRNAMLRGARGVLHKSEPAETILRAIEKVSQGEVWLNRSLLGQVLGQLTSGAGAPAAKAGERNGQRIAALTPREREIVVTLVGHSGAKLLAVADTLKMSENTLRNHLTTIYDKLGVRGRLELHLYATEHGLGNRNR